MILLDFLPLFSETEPKFRSAIYHLQLGYLNQALQDLMETTLTAESVNVLLLREEIRRNLASDKTNEPVSLIWQVSPTTWESDWLKYLLQGAYQREIIDTRHEISSAFMIVIDNLLDDAKEEYYRNAYCHGSRIVLFHLSDERFRDNIRCYRWCDEVFRNYWSPLLSRLPNVRTFMLGYKIGLSVTTEPKTAAERTYPWSFAGDPKKSTRASMIEALGSIPGGKLHLTSGWDTTDALNTPAYQEMLSNSVFAPCPIGNVNIDSFRVSEALECGAIPIVERRPGFDYFTNFVMSPFPMVDSWADAPSIMRYEIGDDGGEALRRRCYDWWLTYKRTLKTEILTKAAKIFS